jgi:hypothetical protein
MVYETVGALAKEGFDEEPAEVTTVRRPATEVGAIEVIPLLDAPTKTLY